MRKKINVLIRGMILMGLAACLIMTGCSKCKCGAKAGTMNLDESKKVAVDKVHKAAMDISEGVKKLKTEKEKIAFVRNYIDPITFYEDKTGYYYVYNMSCINIAHAKQKDLLDKDLTNYKDTKGKLVIQELAKAAKNGGGFVEFYWQKPGATGEKKKIGYVEPIPGTDYFIGSGVYLPEE